MRQYHNSYLSFIDMLFNALIVFAMLFMMSIMIINDPTPKQVKQIDEKAKVMVVLTWNDNSADDMDLWLLTPEPAKIGYKNPNGNIANLARDDLGKSNDMYKDADGTVHYIHLNKEVISIRQKMPGHYVVNVMFYERNGDPEDNNKVSVGPQEVTVQIIELDPKYKEVVTKSVFMLHERDENTAVSFDMTDNGEIVNVDTETQQEFIMEKSDGPVEHDDGG